MPCHINEANSFNSRVLQTHCVLFHRGSNVTVTQQTETNYFWLHLAYLSSKVFGDWWKSGKQATRCLSRSRRPVTFVIACHCTVLVRRCASCQSPKKSSVMFVCFLLFFWVCFLFSFFFFLKDGYENQGVMIRG